ARAAGGRAPHRRRRLRHHRRRRPAAHRRPRPCAAGRGPRPRRRRARARAAPGGPVTALTTPLARLVGDRTAKALAKLGIETAWDLLRHYPRRYGEPGRLTDFTDLPVGDHVTVNAMVVRTSMRSTRNPRTA